MNTVTTKEPRYSELELNIITQSVIENPTNISQAFRTAMNSIKVQTGRDRTVNGISYLYYNRIKKHTKLFTLKSTKSSTTNIKNVPISQPTTMLSSRLHTISSLVPLLNTEEKKELINVIFKSLT